jgi:hypothetical protein
MKCQNVLEAETFISYIHCFDDDDYDNMIMIGTTALMGASSR